MSIEHRFKLLNKFRPTAVNPPMLVVKTSEPISRAGVYSSFGNYLIQNLKPTIDLLTEVGEKGCTFVGKKEDRKLFIVSHDLGELIDSYTICADLRSMQRDPAILAKRNMIRVLRNYGESLGKRDDNLLTLTF